MNNYLFQSDYTKDDVRREKLYVLFEKVFSISTDIFRDYYDRGFWDHTYRPFTYVDGERAIANTSFFSLDLVVNGQLKRAAGIQSVMTDPDYRRKGLMTKLMDKMLGEIDKEFEVSLLMTSSPDLYVPFGFRVLEEHYFVTSFSNNTHSVEGGMRKLEPFTNNNDLYLIQNIFRNRSLLSNRFTPVSYESYFFLNMYDPFYLNKLYLSEDLGAVLVFEIVEGTLRLYDVLAEKLPTIEDICAQIPHQFEKIEVHFYPDRFTTIPFKPVLFKSQDALMARGSFPIEKEGFRFPITANF